MRLLFLILLFTSSLYSKQFTIATYNVQNLFDLHYDGSEYKEFDPRNKNLWNKTKLEQKIKNTVKVINAINADIIGLQEIENQNSLNLLLAKLPQYQYSYFYKESNSAIGVALISKIKPIKTNYIQIHSKQPYTRPILELEFIIENKPFIVYVNHWKSKRTPESTRIDYAYSLKQHLKKINPKLDYIIIGDLNSNYDEKTTFQNDKELNDTYGITGINDILNSDDSMINLWSELSIFDRFSYMYKGNKTTPDNMLVSQNLFDEQGISYIDDSFSVFKPQYLYSNGKINRNQYSDHLPLIATFDTNKYIKKDNTRENSIAFLYTIDKLDKPIEIKNVVVLYKYKNSAIVKVKSDRAIWLYDCAAKLQVGVSYDLQINKIALFNGLKEVVDINIVKENKKIDNLEVYYSDLNQIDHNNELFQNELIHNIQGVCSKGYFYFQEKKIKIYFKDKKLLPKDGQKVIIRNAHLSNYKTRVQLVIYEESDIDVI